MPSEYNWNRSYKIVIGKPEHETSAYTYEGVVVGKLPPTTIKVDAVTEPAGDIIQMSNLESEGDSIRGFKFKLKTNRSSGSSSASNERSTLTLYNLNKESLAVLAQEGCVVRVYLGYEGSVELAYSGDITTVTPKDEGRDIAYQCVCKDGAIDIKNTKVSIQYDEGMTMASILEDLAGRFPSASVGTIAASGLEEEKITGGFSCQGKLINIFNKLCRRNGLTYTRFNGKISVQPQQLIQGTPDYLLVARNTYILEDHHIKSIDPILDNSLKATNQKNTKRGVQITTFLIPVSLDEFITVSETASQEYAGTYKITAISTNASSPTGAFDTTVRCEPM